jgi:hypothetical protein
LFAFLLYDLKIYFAAAAHEGWVKKTTLVTEILALDNKSELVGLSQVEVVLRKAKFDELWRLLKSIDASIFHRSRSKWLKAGDANTAYFHSRLKARRKSNGLLALQTPSGFAEGPVQVRAATVEFFKAHFACSDWVRPTLDGLQFPVLSDVNNDILVAPFTAEEIDDVIMSCDGFKSPGPVGFNFAFIKSIWELMKGEVRVLFDQFHGNACLPSSIFSYFITLIPKVKDPQFLGDFRPISLLGCIYKLVSKVLAARLAKVIDFLIPKTQSAFIKGRYIVDGVVAVNEVIDYAKKSNRGCLILKVDFEKAYDSVDWGFLDYILLRFGFCDKWRAWMRACVCSGHMSVLVNGCPTEEINIKRGLKQGDPLAPHLFLLVADGLGALMRKAVEVERFRPFRIGRDGVPVSLLQYADDTLCIGEASVENLWLLKAVLRGFEMASGLKVNFWKSSIIGVNVSNNFLDTAATFLNCRIGSLPFKYLGLPVGANPRLMSTWKPMVDAIRRRVGSWGNKFLSFGGRIVMVNAILNAIPIYYLSYLKMPAKVWREVIKIQRRFLWSGLSSRSKISWVKWDEVCKPKKDGGLGVRNLRLTNISLLAKWRWKLFQPEEEVWKNIVVAKYGSQVVETSNLGEDHISRVGSSWWRNICLLDKDPCWFVNSITKVVGNGNSTSFWSDVWRGEIPLARRFPRLFSISLQQHGKINQMGTVDDTGWNWNLTWRRNFFAWEIPIYQELLEIIEVFSPADREDSWVWRADPSGIFTAKSAYGTLIKIQNQRIQLSHQQKFVFSNLWKSAAPSKVIAFSWQLVLDRIPSKQNLALRGVDTGNDARCAACNSELESSAHLFLHCRVTAQIWYDIARWIGHELILPPSVDHSFSIFVSCGTNKIRKKGFSLIWHAFIWSIWRARNNRIFNNGVMDPGEICDNVKRISWQWFIERMAKGPCFFYEWRWDPGDCFLR